MIVKDKEEIKNTDIRYDDLGYVNFTGFVNKRRGKFDSFH